MHAAPRRRSVRRTVLGLAFAALMVPALAACAGSGGSSADGNGSSGDDGGPGQPSASATQSAVSVKSNVEDGATDVKVSSKVTLSAVDGTFRTVEVKTKKGDALAGELAADRTSWKASARLDQGRTYVVDAVAADSQGNAKTYTSTFTTGTLSKSEMTYPSVYPTAGSVVGVGMPVIVKFDVPVKNEARFERNMHVTSTSGQVGSWYWIDNQTAHYRPETYWAPNSTINVSLDLKNVPAGNGIYGQTSRDYSFTTSRSLVMQVSAKTDQMKVIEGGNLVRTLPITTGKPGFETRSGTKVIVEKDRTHDMNSETIGIANNDPNGYNLKGVEYAMRLTFSGEFIHAAPWSVGSQGRENVSHGCTGMSTANAGWLYGKAMIGDPVEYVGTAKQMTLTNGYGDWNLSWADWQKGSALV